MLRKPVELINCLFSKLLSESMYDSKPEMLYKPACSKPSILIFLEISECCLMLFIKSLTNTKGSSWSMEKHQIFESFPPCSSWDPSSFHQKNAAAESCPIKSTLKVWRAWAESLNLDTLLLYRRENIEVRQHCIWMACSLRIKSPTLNRFTSALVLSFSKDKGYGHPEYISTLPRRTNQRAHVKIRPTLIPVNLLILFWHSALIFKNTSVGECILLSLSSLLFYL